MLVVVYDEPLPLRRPLNFDAFKLVRVSSIEKLLGRHVLHIIAVEETDSPEFYLNVGARIHARAETAPGVTTMFENVEGFMEKYKEMFYEHRG